MSRRIYFALALALVMVTLAGPIARALPAASTSTIAQPSVEGVSAQVFSQRSGTPAGERLAIAVTIEFERGLHIWPHKPTVPKGLEGFVPIPTRIELADDKPAPPGVLVGLAQAQWPKPQRLSVGFTGEPVEIESYKQTTTVYIPVHVGAAVAAGRITLPLRLYFQACNDTTCFPEDTIDLPVSFDVLAVGSMPVGANAEAFADLDPSILAEDGPVSAGASSGGSSSSGATSRGGATTGGTTAGGGAPAGEVINVLGYTITIPAGGNTGTALVMLIALAGGFILNLTPCVLPVIPLKIIGLQQSAGSRWRLLWLGLMTAVGIVGFWLVIAGLVVGGVLGGISELNSFWQFNLGIGLFMLFMGVGLLGLFTVNLPQWVYAINADHHSTPGAIKFGILIALLATPCVAPLAGAAIAWALKLGSTPVILLMFAAMGVGMALPYLLLAAFPRLVKFIPRAGPASVLLKEVMGLLIIAAAIFFIGSGLNSLVVEKPYIGRNLYWWFAAVAVIISGLWLLYRVFKITPSFGKRVGWSLAALLMPALAIFWANGETETSRENYLAETEARKTMNVAMELTGQASSIPWREYNPAGLDALVAQGQVVMLDFTADWCLICKTLERNVLQTQQVKDAIKINQVQTFRADVTSRKAPGWDRVRALKQPGVPLLVIWGPGLTEPWLSNAYTIQQVVDVLARAGRPAGQPVSGPVASPSASAGEP